MTIHRFPLRVLLGLLAAVAALPLRAAPVDFDIPAQTASSALVVFSKQAAIDVLYSQPALKKTQANPVKGSYEPLDALTQLLRGTGFSAQKAPGGNFVVMNAEGDQPGSIDGTVREEKSRKPVAGARVTVLGSSLVAQTDRSGNFVLEGIPTGAHILGISADGMQTTRVTDVVINAGRRLTLSTITIPARLPGIVQLEDYIVSAKKNDGVIELDPYAVEGTRPKPFSTPNLDLPRTINDPQAYYIFNSETLETSGAVNVEDFLKTRLTSNTTAQSPNQIATNFGGSAVAFQNTINLNGFGGSSSTNHTLILVNGRRRASGDVVAGVNGQTDLSGIPMASIDRIEVLPSSSSGIYGALAMGGVVNVILKRNYAGGEVRGTYQNTFDSDAPIRRIDLTYGFSIRGKTHVMITGSYTDTNNLRLADRAEVVQANINRINQRSPAFFRTTSPFAGRLPNIVLRTGTLNGFTNANNTTLILDDGRPLNSLYTFVPEGTSPTTPTAALASALLANANQQDLRLSPSYSSTSGLFSTLGWGAPKTKSAAISVRHEFLTRLEAFVDYDTSNTSSEAVYGIPTSVGIDIPGNAPNNPFQQNVRIYYPSTDYGPWRQKSDRQTITGGLKATLPHDWIAQFEATWSESIRNGMNTITTDSAVLLAAAIRPDYNPFVDTNLFPAQPLSSSAVISYTYAPQTENNIGLRASGPLFALPGGVPHLTLGGEMGRHGSGNIISRGVYPVSPSNSTSITIGRRQSVRSFYAEADIPLIGPKQEMPGVHSFNLQLANRIDRFNEAYGNGSWSIFGTATTFTGTAPAPGEASYTSNHPTLALLYRPIADVTLRASYATALLPPPPTNLLPASAPNANPTTIFDPQLNSNYGVTTIGGGNPDLKPQNSKSMNVGAIYQPRHGPFKGMRFNLEYQKTRERDQITSPSAQQVIDFPNVFAGRLTRDASGRITLANTSSYNLYYAEVEQYTAAMNYSRRTVIGNVDASVTGTYYPSFKKQLRVDLPIWDYAGYVNSGGQNKLKSNATLNWQKGPWGAGWTGMHYGSYYVRGAAGDPAYATASAATITSLQTTLNTQLASSIPSQIYHDVWLRHAFAEHMYGAGRWGWVGKWMAGTTLQLIVKNVLNTEPPFDANYDPYYYSPYGNLRLREYVLSVKKAF